MTKTGWEGTGIKPDIPVPAEQALLTALLPALGKTLRQHAEECAVADVLKRVIAHQEKELRALKAICSDSRSESPGH